MDWIHEILNVVLPPTLFILLLFLFPPYLLFEFLSWVKRYLLSENVAGKVVLITGASSGIGEHLAYEYARRGARLALVARREGRLRAVSHKSTLLGSPDVIIIPADVSKIEDCKRFIDETLNHFGKLDHLVNNAGIAPSLGLFQDCTQIISDLAPIMNTNFWGSVYTTHFALPHLKRSRGKIIVIASAGAPLPLPRLSVYAASKAALISFFGTLRSELGSDVGITIITPGVINSEITTPEFLSESRLDIFPVESTEKAAKAMVEGACRGERCLTEPGWGRVLWLSNTVCPQLIELATRVLHRSNRPAKTR